MRILKNGINVKWLLLGLLIITGIGLVAASVNPIISDVHSYLDILHVNYLHGDISNVTGVLPNASMPPSALNRSENVVFSGDAANISVTKIGGSNNGSYSISYTGSGGGLASSSGTFTGDGTTNRAIAHSLGKVPVQVTVTGEGFALCFMPVNARLMCTSSVSNQTYATSSWDVTNFYVSGDGNVPGGTERWVALG